MAADPHHHGATHAHERPVSVVEERDTGMGGVIAALLVAALIGFMIWLFAFSGVVFDRDADTGPQITNEQEFDGGTTTDGGTMQDDTGTGGTTDGGDTTGDTTGTTGGGTTDGGTTP